MLLPDEFGPIHQPARLALMALLYGHGDVGASAAREATGLTAGNLDSHAKRLAEAGFLIARKALTPSGFEARYRITPAGLAAMQGYLAWLESFATRLKGIQGTPAPAAESREPRNPG